MADWSEVGRVCIISWLLVSGVISLVGNLIVFLAATAFGAIKLDKIAVILIANLAVADLGTSLTAILPSVGSAVAERWVYGDFFCSATNYIESLLAAASIGLTCALSVAKLTSLLFPFKARTRTKRTGYMMAGVIWVLAALPILPDIFFPRQINFDKIIFRCDTSELKELDVWLAPLKSIFLCFIPFGIVTLSTLWLVYFVHKVRGLQKQSVLTNILISTVFLTSFLPVGVLMVLGDSFDNSDRFHLLLYRTALFSPFVHFMANPLIYLGTVTSFRDFFLCRSRERRTAFKRKQCSVTYGLSQSRGCSVSEEGLDRDIIRMGNLTALQRNSFNDVRKTAMKHHNSREKCENIDLKL